MARAYTTGVVTGVAISLAAAFLAPVWRPAMSRWGRPVLKGAIKQGVVAYEAVRERVAEAGETVSDLLAEVQVEMVTERVADSVAEAAADD
jgi:hypothetical protein